MIGWAAARGSLDREAWALFAVLFLWQLPHFLSIAWIYREEYARARIPHASRDRSGRRVHRAAERGSTPRR